MYSIPCEAIFNRHPEVRRAALVGVGPRGQQQPVIIVEPMAGHLPHERIARARFLGQLRSLALSNPLTDGIRHFMVRRRLPVDIRHNAKIFREKLAVWAAERLKA